MSSKQSTFSLLPSIGGGQSLSRRKAWTVSLEKLAVSDFFDPADAVIKVRLMTAFSQERTTTISKEEKVNILNKAGIEYFHKQMKVEPFTLYCVLIGAVLSPN